MIILETPRIRLRNWRDTDRDLFFEINSDPVVMEFFPKRRERDECDALFDYNRERIDRTGYGFYAMALEATDEPIGFTGLAHANLPGLFADDAIEIGWRLARRFWGKGYVKEAGEALLRLGFEERGLPEIVSFAVAANHRSIAVMRRIGLNHDAARDFDSPRVPPHMPHLKWHVLYAMSAEQWRARQPGLFQRNGDQA